MKTIKYILLIFLLLSFNAWAADHDLTQALGNPITEASFVGGVNAGDTITINIDRTTWIDLENIEGESGGVDNANWFVVRNPNNALITISDDGSAVANIKFDNCRYFKLLGNNYGSETYGIRATTGHRGVWFYQCQDYEFAYLEVDTTTTSGIFETDGDWTESTTKVNVSGHHLYIHDTGRECLYFGDSSSGDHSKFEDIQLYSNRIENCGWDCLQLGQTTGTDSNIYDNTLLNCATEAEPGQLSGIILNPEHTGVEIYQNSLRTGPGNGIYVSSGGAPYIHDNVISLFDKDGITSVAVTGTPKLINNTIVDCGEYGIDTPNGQTTGEVRYNELISNTSGGFKSDYSIKNDNRCPSGCDHASSGVAGEYFTDAANGDFSLTEDSPAMNAGSGAGYSTSDYNGDTRPYGSTAADIGAYEFEFIAFGPSPIDTATGVPANTDLNWDNPTGTTTIDLFLEAANPPTVKVIDDGAVETYNPPADFGFNETWYWKVNNTHGGGEETGDIWSLTTQGFPPEYGETEYPGVAVEWDPQGSSIE